MRSTKLRETHLSYYGPLSLLTLFAVWGLALIVVFGAMHWAAGSALNGPNGTSSFTTDLYMSGTSFFTLGLGDVTPLTSLARVITVAEAGTGFGYLAIVIAYLPTLYEAFSPEEARRLIEKLEMCSCGLTMSASNLREHSMETDHTPIHQPFKQDRRPQRMPGTKPAGIKPALSFQFEKPDDMIEP